MCFAFILREQCTQWDDSEQECRLGVYWDSFTFNVVILPACYEGFSLLECDAV
jgi:hypothetical protein